MGRGPKPAKSKEAKAPVSRKSPKDNEAGVRDLEKRLSEALRQQAATAEILRVISGAPTDIQPVLDAVAERAARLCDAYDAVILRLDGGGLRRAAHYGPIPPVGVVITATRNRVSGRAVVERQPVHVADAQAESEEFPEIRTLARKQGFRTILSVPLLRGDLAIGTIDLRRTAAHPFTDEQIALLKTFADQAVIAIENVRLFSELQERNKAVTVAHAQVTEALEQQTATAEILRVISSSPTDVQPVFDTIVRSAVRLCGGLFCSLFQFDGELIHHVAHHNFSPEALAEMHRIFPARPTRALLPGRAILERTISHIPDVLELDPEFPVQAVARTLGVRSGLWVPMLQEGAPLGVLSVARAKPGPFSDNEIALLKTFADQAVIAIENVRLFKELQTSNRDLTEALEQQTATSNILRVISQSQTDVQPVFDAILSSAIQLMGAYAGALTRIRGDSIDLAAFMSTDNRGEATLRAAFPQSLRSEGAHVSAIRDRAPVNIANAQTDSRLRDVARSIAHAVGYQSMAVVPMLVHDVAVGTISVTRLESGGFTDDEIALLHTFADQAVIAIENVRLFTELQEKNRDLTNAHAQVSEALERQTATADVLGIIAKSPTALQPVLDAIATSAARLCRAYDSTLFRLDGDTLRLVAHHGPIPSAAVLPVRGTVGGRCVLERVAVHVLDLQSEVEAFPEASAVARQLGFRTILTVPLLREGQTIGVLQLRRTEVAVFTEQQVKLLQTFADQGVIAIENVRLFTELQEKNRALTQAHAQVTEALEQQTATSEILGVIASSPTDLQPVFETIVRSATTLCDAVQSNLQQFDGELLHLVATHNWPHESLEWARTIYPLRPDESRGAGRAVQSRAVVHIPDTLQDPQYYPDSARVGGFRSLVSVPMLREGNPIGVISVGKPAPGPFPDAQISLLKTFADQAVIAIENVRLFKELQTRNSELTEALEQQTATGDILRVIGSSPTDVQPVFEAIVKDAARLCAATDASLYRREADVMRCVANYGRVASASVGETRPITRGTGSGRAILDRRTIHLPDVLTDVKEFPDVEAAIRREGIRAVLSVPLLREGLPIGAITVRRTEARPYSDKQIKLIETFADQAVIAIENVRLFKELEARNRDLTEALERQTATGEILNVISASPTDVQPVFAAICKSAVRLFGAFASALVRFDGQLLHFGAIVSPSAEADERYRLLFPRPPDKELGTGRAILDRAVVHVPDTERDTERNRELNREVARDFGYRRLLVVPMMRGGEAIGALAVTGREPGSFSDQQIALLQTFADQAVIAIENVRLFTELQASNRDLTTALDKQTATSDILRVISRSQTDVQPVFDAILDSAVRLLRAYSGGLSRLSGDLIHLAALTSTDPGGDDAVRATFPRPLMSENPHARAIRGRVPVNIADVHTDPFWADPAFRLRGYRSVVAVPLLRQDESIGAISVTRRETGGFSQDEIVLLQTFADQAVIAIENARLLSELQARTRQLTHSVEQLTALGEVGHAVSSSLDLETVLTTIVSRAVQLSGLDSGVVFEYDEAAEEFVHRVATEVGGTLAELRRATRVKTGEGVVGRTALTLAPAYVSDITEPGAYESRLRDNLIESGVRAILAVPMVRDEQLIGCLVVSRNRSGDFPPETIELLRTFATQSALAIQNARLFREIEDKSRQLEAASQHKSEFLANMSHELRTPLNAIIGFSEVLSDRMFGELNEKQEEYLKDIYASGTHLLSLINDILDLSKIEAGRMELELTEFDLPTALDNALMLIRERAGRRSIALHTNIDNRLGQIQADERKVRQVVLNLLSNAIKFTPEGGRIEVGAMPKDAFAQVSVTDTGIGIAPEDQEKVFEEFRQVGTAAKKVEGTGLGLTLCRKFVELHGGRIWVKSELGAGSTFTFTIPVRHGE